MNRIQSITWLAAAALLWSPPSKARAASPSPPTSPPPYVDVKEFGARGDGVSDDTAALQTALDRGAGKNVLIPCGIYVVAPSGTTNFLRVHDSTTVSGVGPCSVIKVKDDAGDYRTVFAQADEPGIVKSITFRDFTIDQNPSHNRTADIRVGNRSKPQYAIELTSFDGVTVSNVSFDRCDGVNTVFLAGKNASNAIVRDSRFRFAKGRTLDQRGEYDNSAVYLDGVGLTATGNTFKADLSAHARAAVEVHGARGMVTANRTDGYETLVNVVTETGTPTLATNDVVVAANTVSNAGLGIRLWSGTGRTLSNVLVAGNVVSVNNAERAAHSHQGVGLAHSSDGTLDGTFDGIRIENNSFAFQADSRAGMSYADSGGVLLYARGPLRNISVSGNSIINAPTQGIRVHSVRGTASGISVFHNSIVDAGNNEVAPSGYRSALMTGGNIVGRFSDNEVIDTGGEHLVGYYSFNHAESAGAVIDSRNSVRQSARAGALRATFTAFSQAEAVSAVAVTGPVALNVNAYERFDLTLDGATPRFTVTHANGSALYQRVRVNIINASGGPGPEIRWSQFKMAPWVNPPNGTHRIMEFEFVAGVLVERWRSGDVPN